MFCELASYAYSVLQTDSRWVVLCQEIFLVLMKCIIQNALANVFDQSQDKMQIVNGGQRGSGHFIGSKKVCQICASVVLTGIAHAAFLNRHELVDKLRIANIETSARRVQGAVTTHARRCNAIK